MQSGPLFSVVDPSIVVDPSEEEATAESAAASDESSDPDLHEAITHETTMSPTGALKLRKKVISGGWRGGGSPRNPKFAIL